MSDLEPDVVVSAAEPAELDTDVFIPNESGVITQIISSPVKKGSSARRVHVDLDEDEAGVTQAAISQVVNPTQSSVAAVNTANVAPVDNAVPHGNNSESYSDSEVEYIPHSDDSGEDSEVVELRRHARKFRKRMRDSKSWIGREATGAVPIELIANMEEQLEREEADWNYDSSDEDYSYDEDSEIGRAHV